MYTVAIWTFHPLAAQRGKASFFRSEIFTVDEVTTPCRSDSDYGSQAAYISILFPETQRKDMELLWKAIPKGFKLVHSELLSHVHLRRYVTYPGIVYEYANYLPLLDAASDLMLSFEGFFESLEQIIYYKESV